MAGESAGTVFVTIQGDASQLQQMFGQVAGQAQQAGVKISTAFNAGTQSAAQGTANLTIEIDRLIDAMAQQSAASSLAMQRNLALGNAMRTMGGHANSSGFSVRYLFLGLKDIAEGRTTFALAELSNQLVRMGPAALLAGGSIAAAIATGYGIYKVGEYFSGLTAAEKLATEQAKELGAELKKVQEEAAQLQNARFTLAFGKSAAEASQASIPNEIRTKENEIQGLRRLIAENETQKFRARQDAPQFTPTFDTIEKYGEGGLSVLDKIQRPVQNFAAAQKNIDTYSNALHIATAALEQLQAKQSDLAAQSAKDQGQQSAGFAEARIANDEKAAKQATDLERARAEIGIKLTEEAERKKIEAVSGSYERAKALADLDVRTAEDRQARMSAINARETADRVRNLRAQLAAIPSTESDDAAGKKRLELEGQIAAAPKEQAKKDLELEGATAEARAKAATLATTQQREVTSQLNEEIRRGFDALDKGWTEAKQRAAEYTAKQLQDMARVAEIQQAAAGEQKSLEIQKAKIEYEGQYATSVAHSLSQQLQYESMLAEFDRQAREAKIAGLNAELATEEAVSNEMRDLIRIAQLKAEIAKLAKEDANASQQSANAIAKQKLSGSAGGRLVGTINGAPDKLAGALASGIVDGKGIGKDIKDSLKGIGKEMLGEVFSGLITAMLGNTLATVANTAGIELNTLFLEIKSLLFGFAGGTSFAPGGLSVVGEKGPEIVNLPRGAQVIPNEASQSLLSGGVLGLPAYSSSVTSSSSSRSFSIGSIHLHGVQNGDQMLRDIPRALKRRGGSFSPFSS